MAWARLAGQLAYDGDHFVTSHSDDADGHPLADPFYLGLVQPAGSVIVARVPLTGALPLLHVQGGPWLNLIAPLAFYVLCCAPQDTARRSCRWRSSSSIAAATRR